MGIGGDAPVRGRERRRSVRRGPGRASLCAIALVAAWPHGEAAARDATPTPGPSAAVEEDGAKGEAAIRALIDVLVRAIRAKDIDGVMSVYAPDLVAFDVVPPLQYVGAEAFRKPWRDVFDRYRDPIDYEVRDLGVVAGDDVAFSHSLNRMRGTLKNGRKTDLWLRWTACYRKLHGKWLIAHLQISVPVDLGSGKARLDLKP